MQEDKIKFVRYTNKILMYTGLALSGPMRVHIQRFQCSILLISCINAQDTN